IKVFWYSSSKEFIKGEERTSEQKHFTLSGRSPKGSSYVRIEVLEAKTTQIQFEIGESSPYKLSLYDLMNNVVLAKKQVEIREKMYNDHTELVSSFIDKEYLTKIRKLFSDNLLTSSEKVILEKYIDEINEYHEKSIYIMKEMDQDIGRLETYHQTFMSDVFNILVDMESDTN